MDPQHDTFFVPDKEDGWTYFWANRADRNMVDIIQQGWELATGAPELPAGVRMKLMGATGQASEVPVSDEIRTRGDLVLVRMRNELYEERVVRPERAAKARHAASLDTLVDQANDQARSAMARARQQNIRSKQVFTTTDDSKFEDQGVS